MPKNQMPKKIWSRIFRGFLIVSGIILLVSVGGSPSSGFQSDQFRNTQSQSAPAIDTKGSLTANQSNQISLANPTEGQAEILSWQERFAAGNFAALSETTEYTIARLEKEYQEKAGEWEYLITDLNGDGSQELFLRAYNGVGIFQEKEGEIVCWYFDLFDEMTLGGEADPFIVAYPTKNNGLLINYQYCPAGPNVIKDMAEQYRFSATGSLTLEHRLEREFNMETDAVSVTLDDVRIGNVYGAYEAYRTEVGWFEDTDTFAEFSSAVPLHLAQAKEYPQAADFEGFWHSYDCLEAPNEEVFIKDAYLRISEQTATDFQLFISVDQNFGEETWETKAYLLNDDVAIFEAPTISGDTTYGILQLTEGEIHISDRLIWGGSNINLGTDCTREVAAVYTRMEQEITDYLEDYYHAFAIGDVETYHAMMAGMDEPQQIMPTVFIEAGMQGIEQLTCLSYPLDEEGEKWYGIVRYGLKISGLDTPLPAARSFLIIRDNSEHWQAISDSNWEEYFQYFPDHPYYAVLTEEQRQEIEKIAMDTDMEYQECLEQNEAIVLAFADKVEMLADKYREELMQQIRAESYISELDGDLWAFLDTVTDRQEQHPLLPEPSDHEEYIKMSQLQTYVVEKGDSLYRIAGKLWQDGNHYPSLIQQNPSLRENPDLIWPGIKIAAGRDCYVRKNTQPGISMGEYRFDTSHGWTVGASNYGSCVLSDSESYNFTGIYCMVAEKQAADDGLFADWSDTSLTIAAYAEQHFGDDISNLVFEQYQLADGELYVYSCLMEVTVRINGATTKIPLLLTAAIKRTAFLQAQFVGFSFLSDNFDLRGETRYMAASFQETEKFQESGVYSDHNVIIQPAFAWELDGLFNPFDWLYNLLD